MRGSTTISSTTASASIMSVCDLTFHNFNLTLEDLKECASRASGGGCESVTGYQLRAASDDLCGFQGEHYKIVVNAVGNLNEMVDVGFFIKALPSDKEKADKLNEAGYFQREVVVYRDILSQFTVSGFRIAPVFFKSTSQCIVLEDLVKYRITDSRMTLDYEHCLSALTTLAKFHAGSIVLEETRTELSGKLYRIEREFKEILSECGYKYTGWYLAGVEAAIAVLDEVGIAHDADKCRAGYKEVLDLCRPSKVSRNVLSHRDLWANNLMFRYDCDPVQCIFVDYQACRCMPPAGDVMSLIYLNTDRKDRNEYLDEYLEHYFMILIEELNKFNIDVPWKSFRSDCDVFKKWALGQATILAQLALMEKHTTKKLLENPCNYERIINVSRKDAVIDCIRNDSIYRNRMVELLEEFVVTYSY